MMGFLHRRIFEACCHETDDWSYQKAEKMLESSSVKDENDSPTDRRYVLFGLLIKVKRLLLE